MTLIQPGDSMAGQQGPAGSRSEAAPLKKGSLSTVATLPHFGQASFAAPPA